MDVSFCVEALEEAIAKYGRPEIFNTDSGQSVHKPGVCGGIEERGHKDQYGRKEKLDGQCVY